MEEKDLLWAFRHSLTDNRKALTKFLLSVDWSVEQEAQQVPALLEQWRSKAGVDISDALKLLGRCDIPGGLVVVGRIMHGST